MKYTVMKPPAESSVKSLFKASVKPKGTAHIKPPGEIRIIGGQYKRTKLPVPNVPGLRPTPDRVREYSASRTRAAAGASAERAAATTSGSESAACKLDSRHTLVRQMPARIKWRATAQATRMERKYFCTAIYPK